MAYIKQPLYMLCGISTKKVINEALDIFHSFIISPLFRVK